MAQTVERESVDPCRFQRRKEHPFAEVRSSEWSVASVAEQEPIGIGPYLGRADEVFEEWRRAIAPLAECANVHAKLGGLAMEVNGYRWHERRRPPSSESLLQATRRYYDQALELFGVDRCMFESNFPVDKVSCSYNVLWNAFKRFTAAFSRDEKAKLFHDNAVKFYGLKSTKSAN